MTHDELHVPILECADGLLGALFGVRKEALDKGAAAREITIYSIMSNEGGAYRLEMLFTYIPSKDSYQVCIKMVPVWHMRIVSWFFNKSLANNVTWLFEIENQYIKFLPQRIAAFCQEHEWWRKYL